MNFAHELVNGEDTEDNWYKQNDTRYRYLVLYFDVHDLYLKSDILYVYMLQIRTAWFNHGLCICNHMNCGLSGKHE